MKTKIQKSELLRGLHPAQGIVDRKNPMEVLGSVALLAEDDSTLLIGATDLNTSLSASLACVNEKQGSVVIDAKRFHDVVTSMPQGDITISVNSKNWAEVKSGKTKCQLAGVPIKTFPRVADHSEGEFFTVKPTTLREMIDKTLFAACADEVRMHLNGVYFKCDSSVAYMVATDGHRLSRVIRKLEGPNEPMGVIVPRKGAGELRKLLNGAGEECQIALSKGHLFVSVGGVTIGAKLIDASFPTYDALVPEGFATQAAVSREGLVDSIRRAQIVSSDKVTFDLSTSKGALSLEGEGAGLGSTHDELSATCQGEDIRFACNPKILLDFLTNIEEAEVEIELTESLAPIVLRPKGDDSYFGVVMPMHL